MPKVSSWKSLHSGHRSQNRAGTDNPARQAAERTAGGSAVRVGSLAVVALVLIAAVSAAGQSRPRPDSFQLDNGCNPLGLFVDVGFTDPDGVTLDRVVDLVRNRLRIARLFDEDAWRWFEDENRKPVLLVVTISVFGRAFVLDVRFTREVRVVGTGFQGRATTWSRRMAGERARNGDFMVQHLSEMLDEFILEYLRVNGEYCDR